MRIAGLLTAVLALGAQDKVELRSRFKKGEKVSPKLEQKIVLSLEQIPDQFKEMFGNKPLDLKVWGTLDLEVKDVAADGTAKLEGRFKTLQGKGNFLQNEVDYTYDSSKPPPDRKDEEEDDESQGPAGMDPVVLLKRLSTQVITLKISELGKVELEGDFGRGGAIAGQLFQLNGLVGVLPKEKVGAGEKWTSADTLSIPGAPFKIALKSENVVEKILAEKSGEVAVIRTKTSVATSESDSSDDENNMFNIKATMTGGGEGTTHFSVSSGRPTKAQSDLKIKIKATLDDPQGGDPLEFKATLERTQKIEME